MPIAYDRVVRETIRRRIRWRTYLSVFPIRYTASKNTLNDPLKFRIDLGLRRLLRRACPDVPVDRLG